MNPLQLIYALATVVAFYVVFAHMKAYEARLTRLENQRKEPEKRVQAAVQDWNKPIEGFNPKKPSTVLPRSEEERNARVKTVREVNENVFEFDSKL